MSIGRAVLVAETIPMKLVMTLLVRDSEDILATNIDYHLARGVDFFIATDNLSEDNTREILEGYRRQGILHLLLESDDNYAQSKWVTRMARMAYSEFAAEWVINSDDDEFWWPDAAGNLKDALQAVPIEAAVVSAERSNFVPRPETAGANFLDTMIVREARSLNPMGKPIPPKICHRAYGDLTISQGNHHVVRDGIVLPPTKASLSILHFPLRTYRQFERRIALGGAAYERNTELRPSSGGTWRMLYDKLKRGELEAYYGSHELDAAAIEKGLAEGRLVHDERLREFVHSHGISSRRQGQPG
jgi:hypothetical protein